MGAALTELSWMQSTEIQGHGGTLHHWITSCFFFYPLPLPLLLLRGGFGTRQIWNLILAMPCPSQMTFSLNSLSLYRFICKMDTKPTLQGCWERWLRESRWNTWHWACMLKSTWSLAATLTAMRIMIFLPLGAISNQFLSYWCQYTACFYPTLFYLL